MANVFIAPKIKVGFQKREDTFTGQLAYIIYYDEKGKLRKEKSWEGWRDKKIAAQEFENTPMDGFTLNKDIKRYHGGWFSSNRTMIRVHDPRGFEFEVTTENLIGILMHTDCLRRGLVGQFVYAWVGPELVLLPTNSEEYQTATKYTSGLAKKVSAKALVPGVSYKTKREGDVIFIGKLNWYGYSGKSYYYNPGPRKEEKVLVFTKDDGKDFFKKSSADFLAEANSDQPVSNYAELVEKFNKKPYANKIVKLEFRPTTFDPTTKNAQYYGPALRRGSYFIEHTPGVFVDKSVAVETTRKSNPDGGQTKEWDINGYRIQDGYYGHDYVGVRQADGGLVKIVGQQDPNRGHWNGYTREKPKDLAYMQSQKFFDLYVEFENGKQRKVNSLSALTSENYTNNDNE
jgi:hypothetical protein